MLTEDCRKKEEEAAKYLDIDLINFVSRGRLIVLQTSGDGFESMSKEERLNVIGYMQLSLAKLKDSILLEGKIRG